MPDSRQKSSGPEPLTVWLSGYLNKVAGIEGDKPLTFQDLWGPNGTAEPGSGREVNLETGFRWADGRNGKKTFSLEPGNTIEILASD